MKSYLYAICFQISNNHGRKFLPLFPGKHYNDQLNHILNVIGSPSLEDVEFISNRRLKTLLLSMPFKQKINWQRKFPNASDHVLDLLEKLLKLNPNNRITSQEGLGHLFVEKYADPDDEPISSTPLTNEFKKNDRLTQDEMRRLIFEESQK